MLVINDEKAWFTPFFVSFKMLIAIDITVTADCYYIYRLIDFYKTQGKVLPIGQLAEWVEMNCNKAHPNIVYHLSLDCTLRKCQREKHQSSTLVFPAAWQYIIDEVRKINKVYWVKTRIFLSNTPPTLIAVL